MEEEIKNSFCNYCKNKRKNCMQIEVSNKNDILIYKCINYVKKDIFPKYEEFNYNIKSDKKK